jgi:branched-subunit amino acid ABC-type transport system permease component
MNLLEQGIGFGLIQASIIAIAAVGFTMQFGIANLLNLAFTEVMSIAGFVVYVTLNRHVNLWVCLLIGAGVGAVTTVAISKLVFDPFRRRAAKPFTLVIISLALNLVLQNAVLAVVGPSNFTYPVTLGQENIRVLHARFSGDELIIMGIAVGLMALLHVFMQFTQMGRAMRALASNRALARSSGIPTARIEAIVWAISGALAGVAGVVLFLNVSTFTPATASSFLVVIVAAAVVGGAGDVYGAMIASVLIGEGLGISSLWIPSYSTVTAFALLIIVLLLRPEGIRSLFTGGSSTRLRLPALLGPLGAARGREGN